MAVEEKFHRLYRWKGDPSLAETLVERRAFHAEDAAVEMHQNGWRLCADDNECTREQLSAEIDDVIKRANNADDLDGILIHLVRRMLKKQSAESS